MTRPLAWLLPRPAVVACTLAVTAACSRSEPAPTEPSASASAAPPASASAGPVASEPSPTASPTPATPPSAPREGSLEAVVAKAFSGAQRVATGDLDGDGQPELVAADDGGLRVVDLGGVERARVRAPGGVQTLRVADVDGDGRGEILAGWGRSRAQRDATIRISLYRWAEGTLVEELVAAPSTPRNDVVAVLPGPGSRELVVATFESTFDVRFARARRVEARWELTPIATLRMAMSCDLGDVDGDGVADLVVGRLYGDEPDADGDAFLLRPDGTRVPIPIAGGVRSLRLSDLDGDGVLDVLVGDGWNKNYGKLARARLTLARWDGAAFQTQLIDESPGQYTIWDALPLDVDGDGTLEILTRGNAQVQVLAREGDAWARRVVGGACRDLAPLTVAGPARAVAACRDGGRLLP